MTIETLGTIIAFLVALISGLAYLYRMFGKFVKTTFKDEFKIINDKVDTLNTRLNETELATCKNFLVSTLTRIERENKRLDSITEERFYENYERYKILGGNSYITHKVLDLQSKGLL